MTRAFALIAALALPGFALAQDAAPFALSGAYIFSVDQQVDGRSICTETWTFEDGGRMQVRSGREQVEKQWRLETDRDGTWIVTRTLSSNGQPDCMGHVADGPPSPDEDRTLILPFNDGWALTCPAPTHTPDGTPFVSNCYGRIVPAGQAG